MSFKKRIIRLLVLAALGCGCYFLWRSTANVFAKLFTMVFSVLFCVSAVVTVLSLINAKTHRGKTLVTLISSLGRYLAAIVILCWGLSILGIDVSGILAGVGILTLVVGFSAESLIADVITGIFMLFENQYNVGDIVEVGGFRGTVCDIGIRTTSIMDVGGNVKIINNSEMKNILNRSDRVSIAASDIDIPYSADLEALEAEIPQLLEKIYLKNTVSMRSVPKYLGVQQLGSSGITLRFIVEVDEQDIFNGTRILNHDLLLGFRKLGIEVPFTQVDVHNS
ncbi:MAG: mechanosensitive ion channel family protein [Oscillospiraceae bacterium]|nr:mechanosensitive ion channel family protein [Oscillospiraceae bacterium]